MDPTSDPDEERRDVRHVYHWTEPDAGRAHRPTGAPTDPDADTDAVELCPCPECGLPAEVVADRGWTAAGELVGVRCVGRHWFFGLRDRLVA